jgi:hypothetical protein
LDKQALYKTLSVTLWNERIGNNIRIHGDTNMVLETGETTSWAIRKEFQNYLFKKIPKLFHPPEGKP